MYSKQDHELVEASYALGLEQGVRRVLDLVDAGITGDLLREQATRWIRIQRDRHQAGLDAEERSEQRGPRLVLVNGKVPSPGVRRIDS